VPNIALHVDVSSGLGNRPRQRAKSEVKAGDTDHEKGEEVVPLKKSNPIDSSTTWRRNGKPLEHSADAKTTGIAILRTGTGTRIGFGCKCVLPLA